MWVLHHDRSFMVALWWHFSAGSATVCKPLQGSVNVSLASERVTPFTAKFKNLLQSQTSPSQGKEFGLERSGRPEINGNKR